MSPDSSSQPLGGGGDEGYLKFSLNWDESEIHIPEHIFKQLQEWRDRLYAAGVVGAYDDGIGYGNISHRVPEETASTSTRPDSDDAKETLAAEAQEERLPVIHFFITGSATGNFAQLRPEHYARVTGYSLEKNSLSCRGLTKASSESLSHAAIYEALPWVGAVAHVHSSELWHTHRDRLPTTNPAAAYGTPEMALALKNLAGNVATKNERVIIMGGHEDGVISFGKSLDEAGAAIFSLFEHGVSRR